MNKTYFFLAGLPRSGSTVLASILNQHSQVYVTPTSPLLDQLIANQNIWHSLQTVKANPVPQQLTNITRALINGMWDFIDKPIIIDKNRGWMKNLPAASILFERDVKTIITTRDLPSIMASWLTLFHKNPNSYMKQVLLQQHKEYNDENIMQEMWMNMVKDCFEGLTKAFKDAKKNQLLVIEYDELISNPSICINQIQEFLQIEPFSFDLNNIKSVTNDDDLAAWGLNGMHEIRPTLQKISKKPIDILGKNLYTRFVKLEKRYRRN